MHVPYPHRHTTNERLPIEVLIFTMDPAVVDEFLAVDHEVWTLGEAALDGFGRLPFISKEVWLNEHRPGQVIITFVWDDLETWQRVGSPAIQQRLLATFSERFAHPAQMRAVHEEERSDCFGSADSNATTPPTPRPPLAQPSVPTSPNAAETLGRVGRYRT